MRRGGISRSVYGAWQTVYGRHRTWSMDGTWDRVLRGLQRGSDGDDAEWVVSVDSTSVRAHHHAAGARKVPPLDVSAERLAVAFADGHREVVGLAGDLPGGSRRRGRLLARTVGTSLPNAVSEHHRQNCLTSGRQFNCGHGP